MEYPRLFTAFQEAHHLFADEEITALESHHLGNLIVTSGQILACDPYYCSTTEPFLAKPISAGRYPVLVSVAHIDNTDQRVALAAVLFQERLPVRWAMALPPGTKESCGYCVDSGTGCFMDADASSAFSPMCENYDVNTDPLLAEMSRHYTNTWGWANLCVNKETGTNLIAFSSGWGDGNYSSYFGYDEQENIICLVTDFGVLDERT